MSREFFSKMANVTQFMSMDCYQNLEICLGVVMDLHINLRTLTLQALKSRLQLFPVLICPPIKEI